MLIVTDETSGTKMENSPRPRSLAESGHERQIKRRRRRRRRIVMAAAINTNAVIAEMTSYAGRCFPREKRPWAKILITYYLPSDFVAGGTFSSPSDSLGDKYEHFYRIVPSGRTTTVTGRPRGFGKNILLGTPPNRHKI